jgi:acyl-coenzyme A thioesterase PaaI-like protein
VSTGHTSGLGHLCVGCEGAGRCRFGLQAERIDADGVASVDLVCPPEFEGGPGTAHGGWTAGALEEVLGRVMSLHGQTSVLGTFTMRYALPVPVGRELVARAWVTERHARKWEVAGSVVLSSSGEELAAMSGVAVLRDGAAHYGRFEQWLSEQPEQ